MGIRLLAVAAAAIFASGANAEVYWVDWTSGTTGPSGSAVGTIQIGATTVHVTYTGEIYFIQTNGGTNYWNPSAPYISPDVPDAPPAADIIALSRASTKTLTFDQPIDDLLFAVVSLNGNGYRFDRDFDILSYGQGYWGNGTLTKTSPSAGVYELSGAAEPHGVIRFSGQTTSITWDSLTAETWNGFTIGSTGSLAPEPSSLYLGLGLLPIVAIALRRRRHS